MQSSPLVVSPLSSKCNLDHAKPNFFDGSMVNVVWKSPKPSQVDETEPIATPVEWGSEAFASQLKNQRSLLVATRPNPRTFARSESLPSRLSPFIERRTVRELAVLLEGKIPIPIFRNEELKRPTQNEESFSNLAEQLSLQMNRLNTVYTPETKQKLFFHKSVSMPCSSPTVGAAEVSTKRSVAELSALLQMKIPGLAGTNNETKKIHSKNAASSTTTFVATKIDDYVDSAKRRPMIQRAESMPLNQSVRQLADQLKHRIPMKKPLVADGNGGKANQSCSSSPNLTVFEEDANGTGEEDNLTFHPNKASFRQLGMSVEGGEISSVMRNRHRSNQSVVSPLKTSRSVAELSSLLKDKIPIRGNRLDEPASRVSPMEIRDCEKSRSNQESIEQREPGRTNLGDLSDMQSGEEAFFQSRRGAVRDVAAELSKKLVFRLHNERSQACIIEPGPIRAKEAANAIKQGLVRSVALDLRKKLVFQSNSLNAQKVSSHPPNQPSTGTASEIETHGTSRNHVSSVARDLQGKLRFRTGDGRVQSQLQNNAESSTQKRPDADIQQMRDGSVQTLMAVLENKLVFRQHREESSKRTDETIPPICRDPRLPGPSNANADEARQKCSVQGSFQETSVVLKEKLVLRQHQKTAFQRISPRQTQDCEVASTLASFKIENGNASQTKGAKEAFSVSFPLATDQELRHSGKSAGTQTGVMSNSKESVRFQRVRSPPIEVSHCNTPTYLCSNCEMILNRDGNTLPNSNRLCQVDASTQTEATPSLKKPALAMDPAKQRKAMIQWRKRSAARSIVKRQAGKVVNPVSFSLYGKASNCSAKKVPKRRWAAVSSSIQMNRRPHTSMYGQMEKIANDTVEKKDEKSGDGAVRQVLELAECEQVNSKLAGEATCVTETCKDACDSQEQSDGDLGKSNEMRRVGNCSHTEATQAFATCDNDQSKEATPVDHIKTDEGTTVGRKTVVEAKCRKQRPPLSLRKLPIIDPIETALCQVFVGQSFRDSFRECSQTRIAVQDPLDSAISDALSDVSNRSWRVGKRVL